MMQTVMTAGVVFLLSAGCGSLDSGSGALSPSPQGSDAVSAAQDTRGWDGDGAGLPQNDPESLDTSELLDAGAERPGPNDLGSFEEARSGGEIADGPDGANISDVDAAPQGDVTPDDVTPDDVAMSSDIGVSDDVPDAPPPLVSPAIAAQVAESLDDICPDTFCGGDFNYRVDSVACGDTGACTIEYRAQPYSAEDAFSADVLDGIPAAQLSVSGEAQPGAYLVMLTGTETAQGVWIRISAQLQGYQQPEDVYADTGGGVQYSEKLYAHFLDALSAAEGLLYGLLTVD